MTRSNRLGLLLVFASLTSVAAELQPLFQERHFGVLASDVPFPAQLDKELTSGLTNRILLRITLLKESRQLRQRGVEIAIRYDLWEENFTAITTVDDVVIETKARLSSADVHSLLHAIRLPQLFDVAEFTGTTEFGLRAEILLNPVERERLEAIRKWVADNSTYVPLESTGPLPGSSMSSAIFNRIFEQYASGAQLAATWQTTLASRSFRPGAPVKESDERK